MNEILHKQNKPTAIYGRVSSSNQENEGTIETQLSAVNEFAGKNGLVIVQKYTDEGWSGDSIARPALDQLRMDAKKKIWSAVLMYDPDRLARRYSYQELVMDELREAGIEVIFVTVSAPKNSEDQSLYGVRGLFAEYERAKIAERFRLGKVRKANEGHIIVSEAPYGYNFILKSAERQGYYEIDEIESQVVKNIFSWVANEGLTLRGVVRRLQDLAISPRKSKRGVWSTSTLSTLLRNKTYIGEAHYGASYAVVPVNPLKKDTYKKIKKTSRRSKPESEWIIIPTPKIIDKVLFLRVQERLTSNFQMCVRNTKNEYLLSHRIWCPCGCRRAGEGPQQGKHLYYRCTSRVKSFPMPSTCKEKGLNARIVDKLVWDKLSKIMSSSDLLLKQADRWVENKNKSSSSSESFVVDVKELKKVISKLKEQEDRFAKAYGTGLIGLDKLAVYTAPLKSKIASLEEQIIKSQSIDTKVSDTSLPNTEEIKTFAELCSNKMNTLSFPERQTVVRGTISKIIGTVSELQVYGRIDVNVITFNRNCGITKCW